MGGRSSYLITIHFKLPNDFDGHVAVFAGAIPGTIDVAESAIAHLLDEGITFEAGVSGHLVATALFLCDNLLEFGLARAAGLVGILLGRLSLAVAHSAVNGIQVASSGRVGALGLTLLFGMNGRDIGGGFGMRRHQAGLFAMTYEILETLYGTPGVCAC